MLIHNILFPRDEDAPAKIADENAVKPEGWLDDEPEYVADPDAEKPEDWYVYHLLQMTANTLWLWYWLLGSIRIASSLLFTNEVVDSGYLSSKVEGRVGLRSLVLLCSLSNSSVIVS